MLKTKQGKNTELWKGKAKNRKIKIALKIMKAATEQNI